MRFLIVFFSIFLCSISLIAAAQPPVQPVDIYAVRVGEHPDKTRIVVELSGTPSCRISTAQNPFRLIIDVDNGTWRGQSIDLPRKSGIVRSVQQRDNDAGSGSGSGYRVVLQTKEDPLISKQFYLPKNDTQKARYVIDVIPKSQKKLLSSADKVAPLSRTKSKKMVVVIDPGHGGKDPGAIGKSGTFEKDITLRVGLELREALLRTGRYEVYMTRATDVFIPLRERTHFAHQKNAALFISLHADSAPSQMADGLSVYTLSEKASDKEAGLLAAKENKADLISGVNLYGENKEVSSILIDLVQRETMNMSARFATALVRELSQRVVVREKTHRFAGFMVLKAPDTPAVLLEMGYISNPREEYQLRQSQYRARIVAGIVAATNSFFNTNALR